MNREEKLIETFGRNPGFTVPDGYFEDFSRRMLSELPQHPHRPVQARPSKWTRLKPYVYLAAMFGGIWLMMNLFHHVSSQSELSLERMPEDVSLAIANADYPEVFMYGPDEKLNDFVLIDEACQEYATIEAFEEAFEDTRE